MEVPFYAIAMWVLRPSRRLGLGCLEGEQGKGEKKAETKKKRKKKEEREKRKEKREGWKASIELRGGWKPEQKEMKRSWPVQRWKWRKIIK